MTTTQFPRVLVALDRIEDAQATVSTLRATQPGRQDLVLLLVLPDDSTVHDIQDALQRLSLEAARLGRSPRAVQTDLRLGRRVTQIVNAARDHEVDVIAMVHHPPFVPAATGWCAPTPTTWCGRRRCRCCSSPSPWLGWRTVAPTRRGARHRPAMWVMEVGDERHPVPGHHAGVLRPHVGARAPV